jgi:hypothetical protein
MRRIIIPTLLLFFAFTGNAQAFIFTDVVAKIQRIAMMEQFGRQIEQMDKYQAEFDKYHAQFNSYYVTFQRIYRHLSSAAWRDFTPSDWARLKDHVITIWKTFDQAAYEAQVFSLTTNPLYQRSPEFKEYADQLIRLSDDLVTQLKKEEAHLIELQTQDANHAVVLERFKSRNAGLVLGEDTPGNEIALSQQIALMNSILIEIATIQAEQKVVQQRLLTQQKEARNLIMKMKQLEIEGQRGNIHNIEQLRELTQPR